MITNPSNDPAIALYRATGDVQDEEDAIVFTYPSIQPERRQAGRRVR